MTLRERFGELEGLRLAFVGDGNNVTRSLAILGRTVGMDVVVAAPEGYRIEPDLAEHTDDLTRPQIMAALLADLRRRGRLGDALPNGTDLALLLIDEYIRFPPPAAS